MSYVYSATCDCAECAMTRMQNKINELERNDKIQVGHIQRLLDADGVRRREVSKSDMDATLSTLAKKWKEMGEDGSDEDEMDKIWNAFQMLTGIEAHYEVVKEIERYAAL